MGLSNPVVVLLSGLSPAFPALDQTRATPTPLTAAGACGVQIALGLLAFALLTTAVLLLEDLREDLRWRPARPMRTIGVPVPSRSMGEMLSHRWADRDDQTEAWAKSHVGAAVITGSIRCAAAM